MMMTNFLCLTASTVYGSRSLCSIVIQWRISIHDVTWVIFINIFALYYCGWSIIVTIFAHFVIIIVTNVYKRKSDLGCLSSSFDSCNYKELNYKTTNSQPIFQVGRF